MWHKMWCLLLALPAVIETDAQRILEKPLLTCEPAETCAKCAKSAKLRDRERDCPSENEARANRRPRRFRSIRQRLGARRRCASSTPPQGLRSPPSMAEAVFLCGAGSRPWLPLGSPSVALPRASVPGCRRSVGHPCPPSASLRSARRHFVAGGSPSVARFRASRPSNLKPSAARPPRSLSLEPPNIPPAIKRKPPAMRCSGRVLIAGRASLSPFRSTRGGRGGVMAIANFGGAGGATRT